MFVKTLTCLPFTLNIFILTFAVALVCNTEGGYDGKQLEEPLPGAEYVEIPAIPQGFPGSSAVGQAVVMPRIPKNPAQVKIYVRQTTQSFLAQPAVMHVFIASISYVGFNGRWYICTILVCGDVERKEVCVLE